MLAPGVEYNAMLTALSIGVTVLYNDGQLLVGDTFDESVDVIVISSADGQVTHHHRIKTKDLHTIK